MGVPLSRGERLMPQQCLHVYSGTPSIISQDAAVWCMIRGANRRTPPPQPPGT